MFQSHENPEFFNTKIQTLIDNNVLGTIDPCISSSLATTRTATVELLTIIVDFNPQLFRDYLMKQSRQEGRNVWKNFKNLFFFNLRTPC